MQVETHETAAAAPSTQEESKLEAMKVSTTSNIICFIDVIYILLL